MLTRKFVNGVLVSSVLNGIEGVKEKPRSIFPEPVPYGQWPIWVKALKQFSKPEDKGIGDVVQRIIGDTNSEAFKAWHRKTFGQDCNCTNRQTRWNLLYPLK